jgi:cyclic pyranopterin phosphate synthase
MKFETSDLFRTDSVSFSRYIGRAMKDISNRIKTQRSARAQAILKLQPGTINVLRGGKVLHGDPLPSARIAAIQAAKSTGQLIPHCHPVPVDFVSCEFELGEETIRISTDVKAVYKTGVEMEALTAAAVAALTLYDMLKMVDDSMEIISVSLLSKEDP